MVKVFNLISSGDRKEVKFCTEVWTTSYKTASLCNFGSDRQNCAVELTKINPTNQVDIIIPLGCIRYAAYPLAEPFQFESEQSACTFFRNYEY